MRWSISSLIGTGTLLAFAVNHVSSSCPYAGLQPRNLPDETETRSERYAHGRRQIPADKKGIFYMNRIAPGASTLYIANADGSNAQALMGNQTWAMDYHPSWSADGQWIVFTSERRADGQADIYRIRPDGTGLETLVETDSFDDAGVLSPDGTKLAYVSTQGNYTTNIWVKDLATGHAQNLTDTPATSPDKAQPQGHYRPTWSPDGEWIALSSDRNTSWTGHSNGTGWEHTQTLSVYVMRPDGSDFRKVFGEDEYSIGTPSWSPDGKRLLCNRVSREDTYNSHGTADQMAAVTGQIISFDVETGTDVVYHTTGPYLKFGQAYLGGGNNNNNKTANIGYLVKSGPNEGLNYTLSSSTYQAFNQTWLRDPSWSPDGTRVVYSVSSWTQRPADRELFAFDNDWSYRFLDVFPTYHNATGRLAYTSKQLGTSSVLVGDNTTSSPDPAPSSATTAFDVYSIWSADNATEQSWILSGLGGAFQPSFSPDGNRVAVGMGEWFFTRTTGGATIYVADTLAAPSNSSSNSSATTPNFEDVTQTDQSTLNAGFPSWSPDGTRLVYRLWNQTSGAPLGLRVQDLRQPLGPSNPTALTWGWDNTPGWSPDGERIVFTRQTDWKPEYGARWEEDRFDVMTIRPDGTELTQLTDSMANDAHAVWSLDGKQILWSSGMYGFRDECTLFDQTFQPYGQIMVMDWDGQNKRMLTDSLWEDSMGLFVPGEVF